MRVHKFSLQVAVKRSSIRQSLRLVKALPVFRVTCQSLDDLDRLYDKVRKQKGKIDVLFANAGIMDLFTLESVSEIYFDKMFGVNVKGIFFTVQKSLPLFNEGGSIVLTGSVAGSIGVEGLSVYGATKAALRSLARSFTAELKNRKIRVNVMSPGRIDTPAGSAAISGLQVGEEQVRLGVVDSIPLGRMGTPDEVAESCFVFSI